MWWPAREETKRKYYTNIIILPQLYQTELLSRSHDQMGHQGTDKVQQPILHRFDWPGIGETYERWVNACLQCLQVKNPKKMNFTLESVESSEFNDVVQIDHLKICLTELGYNKILAIIYHFTKLAETVPCRTSWFKEEAEEQRLDQESGEWLSNEKDCEEAQLSGESEKWDQDSIASSEEQENLCTILPEEKTKNQDSDMQTDLTSGTYNLDHYDMNGGEELEMIAL